MCNKKEICYFCGSELLDNGYREYEIPILYDVRNVLCPLCGFYHFSEEIKLIFKEYRNETAHYLYFHNLNKDNKKLLYIPVKDNKRFNLDDESNEYKKYISIDEIKAFYPNTFFKRINNAILLFTRKAIIPGANLDISIQELSVICSVTNNSETSNKDQVFIVLDHLSNLDYIGHSYNRKVFDSLNINLKSKIWLRAEELEKSNVSNKDVFVAMEFSSNTKDIREYVRSGISNAGFKPLFIDEEIHCEQIMPYMFKKIRESRFLIMETTYPNNGAYYEAGYAEALGKQVIICCRKDKFEHQKNDNEGNEDIKEKSVHFDIAQKNLIIWNEPEELIKKIEKWLEALS